jgi:hypothetical protein
MFIALQEKNPLGIVFGDAHIDAEGSKVLASNDYTSRVKHIATSHILT